MNMNQQLDEFANLVRRFHQPELYRLGEPVYQIWEDGEISFQGDRKSSFLRQVRGMPGVCIPMPVLFHSHSYAILRKQNAISLAERLVSLCFECNGSDLISIQKDFIERYSSRLSNFREREKEVA